jgi:hypothetical protein
MTYKHTYLLFLVILCSVVTVSAQVPFIRGGSERRVIEHVGHEKTLDGQMRAAQREIIRRNRLMTLPPTTLGDDWAISVGSNGPISRLPIFYGAGTSPSCTNDLVAFTTHARGVVGGQANLVVLKQLYQGTTGLCGTGTPTVVAAFAVGTSAAGNYLAIPWISLDGTKIVVLEKGVNSSTPAKLHLITIGSGGGTIASAITPATDTVLSFTAGNGGASCGSSLTSATNLQDLSIWYATNDAYAGDDNGRIYKITNVFSSPAVAYCSTAGSSSNPVTDIDIDEGINGMPAGTNYAFTVLNGHTLQQYEADNGATAFTLNWSHDVTATPGSINDFIVADDELKFVYLVSNHDSTGNNAVLDQWDYSGTRTGEVVLGPSSSQILNQGAWDHNYQTNVNASATYYVCAYPSGASGAPNLSDVQFDSSWHLKSTFLMTGEAHINNPITGPTTGNTCGPIYFYTEDDGVSPHMFKLIVGTGNGTVTNSNRVASFNITNPITNSGTAATDTATAPGGISGWVQDNFSSLPGGQTFNVYYGTLAAPTSGGSKCGLNNYCLIKAQINGLN